MIAGTVGAILVAVVVVVAQSYVSPLDRMAAISPADHIRGNPDASVKIVEYFDTECVLCKRSFFMMRDVVDGYGGQVALVFRHFPIPAHPKARKEAEALECADELGGNDAFWKYADRIFEITPSGDKLDPAELPKIARYVGLDMEKFTTCLASGRYGAHVEEDYQNAIATGGKGHPWSIVVGPNGTKYPLSGTQPREAVQQLVDLALKGS